MNRTSSPYIIGQKPKSRLGQHRESLQRLMRQTNQQSESISTLNRAGTGAFGGVFNLGQSNESSSDLLKRYKQAHAESQLAQLSASHALNRKRHDFPDVVKY